MSEKSDLDSSTQSRTSIRVAIISGTFTLTGAIVYVIVGPLIMDWYKNRKHETVPPPLTSVSPVATTAAPARPSTASSVASSSAATSAEIHFTCADGFESGLAVERVWAHRTNDDVEFRIDFSATADRQMLFFDPPAGRSISIRRDLPAASKSILFSVSRTDLLSVSNITVSFTAPGASTSSFIFLDYPAIGSISR